VSVPFPWLSSITEYTCPLAEVSDGAVGAATRAFSPGEADEFDDGDEVVGDPIGAMSPQFHLAAQK
jgi:hypothetical protein